MRAILRNRIKCNKCQEVIESFSRHDFKMCNCGNTGIDGGASYQRRIGNNWTEMSILDNGKHESRREVMLWGVNKGNFNYEYRLIKDLDTNHIYNILITQNLSKLYRDTFEDEIIFREELYVKSN